MKKANKILLVLFFAFSLVSPVAAQPVLRRGKIPKDLIITLGFSSTVRFSDEYDLKITARGKVYLDDRSHRLPVQRNFNPFSLATNGNKPRKIKTPKLKNKLSQSALKRLILDIEKAGFFEMKESYYGDPNLRVNTCWNHADTKSLSVSANGKTKKVAFFLGCSYGEASPLKSFLRLYERIDAELSRVKKINFEESADEKPESKNRN